MAEQHDGFAVLGFQIKGEFRAQPFFRAGDTLPLDPLVGNQFFNLHVRAAAGETEFEDRADLGFGFRLTCPPARKSGLPGQRFVNLFYRRLDADAMNDVCRNFSPFRFIPTLIAT